MKKRMSLLLSLLFVGVTNASATPMYCAANILNADPITAKVREIMNTTLQGKCTTQNCKDNVASFVARLPSYPVSLDTTNLTYHAIPKVDHYHTSLCYEVSEGDIPACDALFNQVDEPALLETVLRTDFKASIVTIKNLRSFFVDKTGEYWLVAELSPIKLTSGKSMNLHISLLSTKDKSFLDEIESTLKSAISGISLSLGDVSCRIGIHAGTTKKE